MSRLPSVSTHAPARPRPLAIAAVLRRLCGTLCVLLLLAPALAAAVVWTEPAQPVAGSPTRVVFTSHTFGGPLDVEVQVEGTQVLLVVRDCGEGGDVCFSAPVPVVLEAMLPPLAAGSYTVATAHARGDGEPEPAVERGTIDVVAAASAMRVLPAEGFWSPVGQPGSGLFLERRGALLAVSRYSYAAFDGAPSWQLGTGSYSADTVPMVMHSFGGGDCLGCEGHQSPQSGASNALRLRLESARRAWLDLAGTAGTAEGVPMVSLPYGASYLPVTLADSVDDEFGPLPLPDLRGTWLFAIEGPDAPGAHLRLELNHVEIEDGVVHFRRTAGGLAVLTCRPAEAERRAGCWYNPALFLDPPPPPPLGTFYEGGWFIPLGDIEEDRMRGLIETAGQTWRVRGFRIDGPPPEDG